MTQLLPVAERFVTYQPLKWEEIPDIGLYMDQVVSFIAKHFELLTGQFSTAVMTSSMINNYVKNGVIPRPVKKKYDREQLAMLLMMVTLKQSSSLENIALLLHEPQGGSIKDVYEAFCDSQVSTLRSVAEEILCREAPSPAHFAIISATCRLACEALIREAREEKP